jgi:hypothetical protein
VNLSLGSVAVADNTQVAARRLCVIGEILA